MARDLSAYLQDIYDACVAIEEVTEAVSLEEYRARRAVRSSVEREFIIIGEALRRISVLDGAVDDDSVFGLVYSDLVVLKEEVGNLLHNLFGAN